ncbi:MAG: ABC transporter permease [Candidatus Brachytrichaceae bacterium NZ_4S206]|jgi:oligopeptide transport system permease protein
MAQATTSLPRAASSAAPAMPSQSQWELAWRRLRRNRAALVGGVLVVTYILVAIFASSLAPHNPIKDYGAAKAFLPPFWQTESPAGKAFDPAFPLGTDQQGRDVLSRILYGTRTSIVAGVLPVTIVVLIGATLGFVSGYLGGGADNLLMRITDIFYAIPTELLLILVMVTLGDTTLGKAANGVPLFLLALAAVSWSGLARLMRGSALALKNLAFVEAAQSLGASRAHIITRHILPNSVGVLVVWIAFAIPRFIIAEAILGYIGLGLRPSLNPNDFFITSWGRLFLDAYSIIGSQPGFLLSVAAVVSVLVISFTFLGDGLRDALDPRMKK